MKMTTAELFAAIEAAFRNRYQTDLLATLYPDSAAAAPLGPQSPFVLEIAQFLQSLTKPIGLRYPYGGFHAVNNTVYNMTAALEPENEFDDGKSMIKVCIETMSDGSVTGRSQMDRNFARLAQHGCDIRIWVATLPTAEALTIHLANCRQQIDSSFDTAEFLLVLLDRTTGQTTVETHRKTPQDRSDQADLHDTSLAPYQKPAPGRGRDTLLDLRHQLLSLPPGEELDSLIFKTLESNGVDHFLRVSRLLTYHVGGKARASYGEETSVLLAAIDNQHGYSFYSGHYSYWKGFDPFEYWSPGDSDERFYEVCRQHELEVKESWSRGHYVCHEPISCEKPSSFFMNSWTELPKYTTDVTVALRLKNDLLRDGPTLILEETKTVPDSAQDDAEPRLAFRARINDPEGREVCSPTLKWPAVAVLLATLDYLLKIMDKTGSDI